MNPQGGPWPLPAEAREIPTCQAIAIGRSIDGDRGGRRLRTKAVMAEVAMGAAMRTSLKPSGVVLSLCQCRGTRLHLLHQICAAAATSASYSSSPSPLKVKSMIPEHCLQNMDSLGLQQLEHLEKELEQAKKKILVLKAQEHRETSSPDTKQVSESRYWTNEERQRFKKALKTFGTDFAAIAKFVGTRSSTQVRTHAQKYYAKLIRDYKRSGKAGTTTMKAREDATTRLPAM